MSGDFVSPSKANLYVNTNVNAVLLPGHIDATDTSHAIQADIEMLLKNSEVIRSLTEGQPILVQPSTAGKEQLTNQAKLTLLLGQMAQVALNVSEVEVKNNLAMLIVSYTAMKANYTGLSDAFEAAIDSLTDIVEKLNTASDKLAETTEQHQVSEKRLQELTNKLSQLTSEDSEYQETLLQKQQAEVNEKKAAEYIVQAKYDYKLVFSACDTAVNNANKAYDATIEVEGNYPSQVIVTSRTDRNTIGRFIELIVSLLQIVNESNFEAIKSQSHLMKAVNEARLNELLKKSDEIEKKQQTASNLRKGLSIFAAIVSAVLVIVSVVASIPTGGMGLAAGMGLGAALTSAAFVVTDVALRFTIDFSPMNLMFDKINDGIGFLVKHTLSILAASLAEVCGASEDEISKAKEYCTLITSAILTTVIIILPSILLGVGLSQVASKAANVAAKTAQTSVNTATNATVKAANKIVEQVASSASKSVTLMNNIASSTRIVQLIFTALSTVVSPTLSIIAGVNEKAACDALAKLGMNEGDIKCLSDIRRVLAKQAQSVSGNTQELNKAMCEVLNERVKSLQTSFRNIERLGAV
ncbi:TPA: type III secretion system translocon subunit SctE [Yersinia enterocolitica]|nr:type III secretion system translocon subunit SctE [Yersinia enterocolitica]HDL6985266.1 type III secretion system translocon subunit SctE [Yersinia enterocolitica]HDL7067808.1 type III secretion system translocon subunit SctE [Yersinia enterocolitica]HDL7072197.1 type III secretion system translocon subunit SctE [Yersinia enterocolitica]